MRYGIKKKLAILLCIAMSIPPVPAYAVDAAVQGTDEAIEETLNINPDVPAGEAQEYSAQEKEEIREYVGAESVENIIPGETFDEAEIRAEAAEKEAYDRALDEYKVDDSYKLNDDPKEAGAYGYTPAGEEQPEEIWPFDSGPASTKFNYTIGGSSYNDTLDAAVNEAAKSGKPVYFKDRNTPVSVHSTIEIPSGKKVELHFNGALIGGSDKLGNNEIFKVGSGATLRIYGTDNEGTDAKITRGRDGAIIADNESTVELNNLTLLDNSAKRNGGALYLGRKVCCRLNCVNFLNNKAGSSGGALYVNGNTTNIHLDPKVVFKGNTSQSNGGAVYINAKKVNMFGPAGGMARIENNRSVDGYGGGIYVDSSDFSACSFIFSENEAKKDGGAVYFNGSGAGLANCEITQNNRANNGAGVYVNDTGCGLSNVKVTGNLGRSGCDGGGVYVDSRYNLSCGGKVIIKENTITSSGGSDLFLQKGKITQAYLKASSYEKGSKIGIGVSDYKEGTQISYAAGNYDQSVFYCNKSGWFVTHGQDKSKELYRYLFLTGNKATAHEAAFELLEKRKENKDKSLDSGKVYVASDGKSYPVYYGYASSPNHADEERDIVNKYFYSDGYFFDDPKTYNPHLATFGMNLAMASADSNVCAHDDYSYKFDNVKSMLAGMGCDKDSIYISPSYIVKPTDSSIGIAIGKKEIRSQADNTTYTLIPIAVRSYNYEKEWASNMTINGDNTSMDNGEHSGFKDASTKVMGALKDYIADNDLESSLRAGKVKFFIVGFSRGSATANLTGAKLVNTYGMLSSEYKPNDVFAYCFAVPAGGTDTEDSSLKQSPSAYYCIHNIINKVDLTPMVGPLAMGFKRYGVDHYVPGDNAGSVKKVVKQASAANGSYPVTLFYDNNAYMTNSSAYTAGRPGMLKQLTLVNDDIHFVDHFKEADLDVGVGRAIGQTIKGIFTYLESEPVKINEVANSSVTIEEWLPKFYDQVQTYKTLGADKTLTRKNYSTEVVKAGKINPSSSEKNWYAKGNTAQDTFRSLVMLMLSKTPSEKTELGLSFSGIKNKLDSNWDKLVLFEKLINSDKGWDYSDGRQQDYLDMFWNMLNDNKYGQKGIQDAIKDKSELASLENSFPSLMSIVLRIVRQDYNDKDHSGHMRLLGTFANNTEAILQGHVPEIALAWLRANDDYYNGETKAYAWAVEPGYETTAIKLTGVKTDGSTNPGDCKGELTCEDPSAEIYYTVECGGVTTQPSLYSKGKSILFAASGTGEEKTYNVKAWIYRSRAEADKKVTWSRFLRSGSNEQAFTVKVAGSEKHTVTLKVDNGNGAEAVVRETFSVGKGETVSIKKSRFTEGRDQSYWFGGYTTGSTEYKDETLSLVINSDTVITAKFIPMITEIILDSDFYTALGQPVAGQTLNRSIPANKIKYRKYKDQTEYSGPGGNNINVEWAKISGSKQVKVTETEAKPGTRYRAYIDINSETFGRKLDDKVQLIKDEVKPGKKILKQDGISICFDFQTEGLKKITDCNAGNLTVSVRKDNDRQSIIESLSEAMPVDVGNIATNDGISLSGCAVTWNYDNVPEPNDNTNNFSIRGQITDTAVKAVADHSWDEWKTAHPGFGEYEVSADIILFETAKLAPPTASPGTGSYILGEDPVDLDDAGKLKVVLRDPNDNISGSRIKYTLKDESGVISDFDDKEYTGPISIPKPAAGETKTYILSANCVIESTEYESSEVSVWTYTISNPTEKHKLRVFVDDYNDPADYEEIRAMSDEDFDAVYYLAQGEDIILDMKELPGDYILDSYRVVSWNVVTDSDHDGTDIPDSGDDLLWYTMPDHDVYVMALTAPIVSRIDIGLDEPETGSMLSDNPYSAEMIIGDEVFEIDPDTVTVGWTLSEDLVPATGNAKANTGYSAHISVSADELNAITEDEYGNIYSDDLDLKYFVSDDVRIFVYSGEDSEKELTDGYIVTEDDKGLADIVEISTDYDKTGKASFMDIVIPEEKTVSWNGVRTERYERLVEPILPRNLNAYVDDDSYQTLSINWVVGDEEKAPMDGMDDQALWLNGYCVIPGELDYDKDDEGRPVDPDIEEIRDASGRITEVRYNFEYPVTLEGAPVSNMPDISPLSDEFEIDDDIVAEFDTFPVTESENSVKVYYMITPVPEDEDDLLDAVPCWYDENWEIVKDQGAKILDVSGNDIEDRRIIGKDYAATGARVSAIAVEDGCRMSALATEDYIFHEKPTAEIPDEVFEKLDALSMPSGSSLNSIVTQLPENCSFDPEEDLTVSRTGRSGEVIYVSVVYNPDPGIYRDAYIDAGIKLTAGIHNISVENGTAYLVGEDTQEWKKITQAEAMSRIVLSANEAPAGMEFDKWLVFSETGEEIPYVAKEGDDSLISFDMPDGEIYAIAVYEDKTQPSTDPVESLTLDISAIDIVKGGEAKITANVTYASGTSEHPGVEFKCAEDNISLTPGTGNTVTVKALSSGRAVVWAVCGQKTVCCTVTVGETKLSVVVVNGHATLPDGTVVDNGTVNRGVMLTLTADSPKNQAMRFKEWEIIGANIDRTKNPVSFSAADDIVAMAVYTEAEGYEDPGEYPYTGVKVRSLKLTDPVKGKGISKASIGVNGSVTVNAAAVYNTNDTVKPAIVFRSSNTDVVKVRTEMKAEGSAVATIVGCQTGTAVVTAYCGNKKAKLNITVEGEDIKDIELLSERISDKKTVDGQYRLELISGEQELVSLLPEPFDSTAELKVTWKSDDTKVASVNNGLITAKGRDKGRTTIRVTVKSRPQGAKKWVTHDPVLIAVMVTGTEPPKKIRQDKSYTLGIKGSQILDLDAGVINKKNVVSECSVGVKVGGVAPKTLKWETTNDKIVKIVSVSESASEAKIKATGIGTAYITVTGSNDPDLKVINRAVMKVTVKATAPEVKITADSLGLLSKDGKTLTIKEGSYDRLYYSITTDSLNPDNVTQLPSWSASGGVTVKNGILYAKKATRPGRNAKVTLKSGRSKYTLEVIVK